MSDKIKPQHLSRKAILYVRQSSPYQVMNNLESQKLQYAMEAHLRSLGWSEVEIIDEDLGRSAGGGVTRTGFERMVAQVCLGEVGAVCAREVSRFARNSREWQQLVEVCRIVDTLLVDQETNSSFNQFGLDFYTNFAARLSIYQDGTIGMGNSTEKFGGTQVFINPPAGDNSNIGLIALGQETFDAGFSGGDGVHGSGGLGASGGFDGTGGVFFGGCCAGFGDGMVVWPGSGIAAFFEGDVSVFGNLSKSSGSFKIDHPLDPANKYLYHSFVESPDMKNIYDGVVTLDGNGEAAVQLPDWFDALNKDFRYQLTSIGGPGPNLYISQEVSGNHFAIAGGKPGMRVSWQVTGTRQDAWANAHRIPVEEEKSPQERGYYIAPELFGQAAEKQVTNARHPEMVRRHKQAVEQSRNAARALQQHHQEGLHLERLAHPAVQPSDSPNP